MAPTTVWVVLGMVLVVGCWVLAPLAATHLAGRFARRQQVPDPSRHRPALERRLTARYRATALGMVAAAVLYAIWPLARQGATGSGSFGDVAASYLPFVLVFGCVGVGQVVAELIAVPRPDHDAPRTARAHVPALQDYVTRVDALGPRVMTGLTVALAAVATGVSGLRWFDFEARLTVWMAIATLVTVAAWVLGEMAVRRVLDTPQPAAAAEDLYWQDAVRADTLRSIVTAGVFTGTFGYFTVLAGLEAAAVGSTGQPGADPVPAILIGALLVFLTVAVVGLAMSLPQRHRLRFRRRLWSEPAVGDGAQPS